MILIQQYQYQSPGGPVNQRPDITKAFLEVAASVFALLAMTLVLLRARIARWGALLQ